MRLHLNPRNKLVQRYLQIGARNNIVSFHFYNQEKGEMIDSITNLDEEEIDWFKRNALLTKRLRTNPNYKAITKMRIKDLEADKNEMVFDFYRTQNPKLLIKNATKFYKYKNPNYFYDKGTK